MVKMVVALEGTLQMLTDCVAKWTIITDSEIKCE